MSMLLNPKLWKSWVQMDEATPIYFHSTNLHRASNRDFFHSLHCQHRQHLQSPHQCARLLFRLAPRWNEKLLAPRPRLSPPLRPPELVGTPTDNSGKWVLRMWSILLTSLHCSFLLIQMHDTPGTASEFFSRDRDSTKLCTSCSHTHTHTRTHTHTLTSWTNTICLRTNAWHNTAGLAITRKSEPSC